MILKLRRRLARFLRQVADLLMLDYKLPRLLKWAAQKISPDPAPEPRVTLHDRYSR